MIEPPTTIHQAPAPVLHASDHAQALSLFIGFLTIVDDSSGVLGGYLVTNAWGRPLEFRLSTAVQPNRVQQILYGPTLTDYLHADLIGKTLIEKTSVLPGLLVTDSVPALALRHKLNIPIVAVPTAGQDQGTFEVVELHHPRSRQPLLHTATTAEQLHRLRDLLDRVDPSVDLSEPFARIHEAVSEARKMGVTNRAA